MVKKTKSFNEVDRKWVLIDAKDKVLGRISTRIAIILQGKNKATYTPNFLCGDNVVVINAKYLRVTGKKLNDKIYDKYTGYPNGRVEMNFKELMVKNPIKALQLSVKGMLPKSSLGKQMIRSLKIYPEAEHLQQAQTPKKIEV